MAEIMKGPLQELGYLLVDNRLSGGGMLEASTFTCTHCGAVVVMNPDRTRPRAKCHGCRHPICDGCAVVYSQTHQCELLAQKIDEQFESVARGLPAPAIILPPERNT